MASPSPVKIESRHSQPPKVVPHRFTLSLSRQPPCAVTVAGVLLCSAIVLLCCAVLLLCCAGVLHGASSFVLISFILGILSNKPEIPLSINGIQTKLSGGESAIVLMSLLGATLVPHNFYLHSSIVQGSTTISKDALCHSHFLAIICVFSGLYLVNNVLMNAAANEFYSIPGWLH